MLSFKDTTFCTASCTNNTCARKLTPDVVTNAEFWWGGAGAPIAVSDFSNSCATYEPVNSDGDADG